MINWIRSDAVETRDMVEGYESEDDQIVICSKLGCRYQSGVQSEEDCSRRDNQQDSDCCDELAASVFVEAWYGGQT